MSIIHNLHMILPFPRIEANHNFRESPVAREWRLAHGCLVSRLSCRDFAEYEIPGQSATRGSNTDLIGQFECRRGKARPLE